MLYNIRNCVQPVDFSCIFVLSMRRKTKNQIMAYDIRLQEAKDLRDLICNEIKKVLKVEINISISCTNFGTSMYIQNDGYGKIRISDHSVENYDRIFNEIHYNINNVMNVIHLLIEDVEKVFFPERFKKVTESITEKIYSNVINPSIEHFEKYMIGCKIESYEKFTNKKEVEKFDIKYSKYTKREITKIVRI